MKTIKEINEHLLKVGYTCRSMNRICDFLDGIIEKDEFEVEFTLGENEFEDFKEWFNSEEVKKHKFADDEFMKGDFIHVEKDLDVLVLSDLVDGHFVGTNGTIIHQYELTDESRPCNEYEIKKVENHLEDNGVAFCYDCDELEPTNLKKISTFEEAEKLCEENKKLINELLRDVFAEKSKSYDKIEIEAKEAIENIIANLHESKITNGEREQLDAALDILIELGKMYE